MVEDKSTSATSPVSHGQRPAGVASSAPTLALTPAGATSAAQQTRDTPRTTGLSDQVMKLVSSYLALRDLSHVRLTGRGFPLLRQLMTAHSRLFSTKKAYDSASEAAKKSSVHIDRTKKSESSSGKEFWKLDTGTKLGLHQKNTWEKRKAAANYTKAHADAAEAEGALMRIPQRDAIRARALDPQNEVVASELADVKKSNYNKFLALGRTKATLEALVPRSQAGVPMYDPETKADLDLIDLQLEAYARLQDAPAPSASDQAALRALLFAGPADPNHEPDISSASHTQWTATPDPDAGVYGNESKMSPGMLQDSKQPFIPLPPNSQGPASTHGAGDVVPAADVTLPNGAVLKGQVLVTANGTQVQLTAAGALLLSAFGNDKSASVDDLSTAMHNRGMDAQRLHIEIMSVNLALLNSGTPLVLVHSEADYNYTLTAKET